MIIVDEALSFADRMYTKSSFAGVLAAEVRRLRSEIDSARDDLQSFVDDRNHWKTKAEAAEAALKEAQEQEPVAWMHDKDGRVDTCHDSVKKLWLKVGQQQNTQFMREIAPCRVEHYNIPLYARPVLARAEAAESDAASWADQCSQRVADWDEMRIRAEAAEAALKEAQEQAAVAWWCGEDLTSNHDQAKWFESFTGEDALPLYASPVPAAPAVAFNISDNVDANTSSAERIDDNSSAPAVAAPAVQDDCVSQDESTMMMAASALVLYRAGESAEYMAKAIEALLQSNGCSSQTQNEVRHD